MPRRKRVQVPAAPVEISQLADNPELLPQVLALHRTHSRTLGFMPEGAFEDHRDRRQLLVAIHGGRCVGYVLFRRNRRLSVAIIAHLCVAEEVRGKDVARRLVVELRRATEYLDGIRAKCRRDYVENGIWPRLGFTNVGESRGHSDAGHLLDTWWLAYRELPLLERAASLLAAERRQAAVDFNIFIDLYGERKDEARAQESLALLEPWLADELVLCVTPEMSNELSRDQDPCRRARQRELVSSMLQVHAPPDAFDSAYAAVVHVLGEGTTDRERSDRRQLAGAAAARVEFFVTRDEELLLASDELGKTTSLTILRPSDLIGHLDALVDDARYQPRRFEGSRLRLRGVAGHDERRLSDLYLRADLGETKSRFLDAMRMCRADVKNARVLEIVGGEDDAVGLLLAITRPRGRRCEIEMLRPSRNRLAPTVLRQFLATELANPASDEVVLNDSFVCAETFAALTDCGFFRGTRRWVKPAAVGIWPTPSSVVFTQDFLDDVKLASAVDGVRSAAGNVDVYRAERMIWPAKLRTLDLPVYIVSIQSSWAMALFDSALASGDLFGLPPELGFRLENAYYRAAVRRIIDEAPARLLWYVSQDPHRPGTGAIRASSYLDDVQVGPPKVLFREHRRLGVFRWEDVIRTADHNQDKSIMALRFSGTELFEDPVPRKIAVEMLNACGRKSNNFISPLRVPGEFFFSVYAAGRRLSP